MNCWVALVLGMVFSGLVLAIEHWFPYTGLLTLIQKYTAGVLALWAGFALWRWLCGDWVTPLGLLAICFAGGAAVAGGYWLDDHKRRVQQAKATERNDRELQG